MSRSRTITNADWLHNPHAGEILFSEFMEPVMLDTSTLAKALQVPAEQLQSVIDGDRAMDAALDLRLARYFRMSEGYFMRLQNSVRTA